MNTQKFEQKTIIAQKPSIWETIPRFWPIIIAIIGFFSLFFGLYLQSKLTPLESRVAQLEAINSPQVKEDVAVIKNEVADLQQDVHAIDNKVDQILLNQRATRPTAVAQRPQPTPTTQSQPLVITNNPPPRESANPAPPPAPTPPPEQNSPNIIEQLFNVLAGGN